MVGTMAKIDDSVKKKVPELRFAGFADDWEQRKFDECFNFPVSTNSLSRALLNYDEGDIQSVHYGDILIKYPAILNVKNDKIPYITDSSFEKYKSNLLENGDLIFADAAEDETVGKAVEVNGLTEENLVAGLHTIVARSKDKKAEFFLGYYINSNTYHRQLLRLIQGSKVSSISKGNLQKTLVSFPKDFEEQQKIGAFFKQLDETIALHQRKLDLLKEQKKGYLQKMFPKNGEKVPELRFAGFADDWEERKLSDVANHRGGTAIEKYFDKDGVYKVISIGSYGLNSQYVDQNIRAISNEITDGRVVNSGELTMVLNDKTANGTIIGRTLLVEKDNEYVINQRTEIISPKENFDSNFAYTILNGPFREKVKRIVQGGTQIYVNYPAVSNLNLELPKIEEQQKIGSFFKQLDDTIALHQRKLDLLKEQKKGFLQKMFV